MWRKSCAHYMVIAHVLDIYTHMPYSVLTFQISSQLTHTHSFIASAYLPSIVRYIRFMYGDLAKASHQSYRFTAKSRGLLTYHRDRAIMSAPWLIFHRPAGQSAFVLNACQRSCLSGWSSLQPSSCPLTSPTATATVMRWAEHVSCTPLQSGHIESLLNALIH